MVTTVKCRHCSKDFEADAEERTVFCPHCEKETPTASFQTSRPLVAAQLDRVKSRLIGCADCGAPMSRRALWCPACGSIQRSLFGLLFEVAGTLALVWLAFAVLGWFILKLIEAAFAAWQ
jgi:DNA-directed RNA polymerase subunit RPC12/RpoP